MAVKKEGRRGLGRGLDALIPIDNNEEAEQELFTDTKLNLRPRNEEFKEGVVELDINRVISNKNQPRKYFDSDRIAELAESIREHGVIQPIIVRKFGENWMIIAGERRWRASKAAGLKKIPAIVKDISERELVEVSLIENIQREDLNPIEEAEAYDKLINEYNFTQETLGKSVGKDRSTITNSLRLLKSSARVKEELISGGITSGHARAILALTDRSMEDNVLEIILKNRLSVRETEKIVKKLNSAPKETPAEPEDEQEKAAIEAVKDRLIKSLGTKVSLTSNKGKGKIIIDFYSNDDLERILEIIG